MAVHRFHDLDLVIDEVHALFDAWEATGAFAAELDEFGFGVLRLAVHEWVANLIQHAAFGRRRPEIALDVTAAPSAEHEPGGVRCRIEDNSDGFDFHRQVERQGAVVGAPEPSERGRGLLMLIACTESLDYVPVRPPGPTSGRLRGRGRQRLSFLVRNPTEAVGLAPLFHLSDEA